MDTPESPTISAKLTAALVSEPSNGGPRSPNGQSIPLLTSISTGASPPTGAMRRHLATAAWRNTGHRSDEDDRISGKNGHHLLYHVSEAEDSGYGYETKSATTGEDGLSRLLVSTGSEVLRRSVGRKRRRKRTEDSSVDDGLDCRW